MDHFHRTQRYQAYLINTKNKNRLIRLELACSVFYSTFILPPIRRLQQK